MKKLIAALILLVASWAPAYAANYQAIDSVGNTVTLNDVPCTSKEARMQLPRLNAILREAGKPYVRQEQLSAATVIFQGKKFEACWVRVGDLVIVMDDAGEENSLFPIPAAAFNELAPL
jgi:hypothetical protein